MNTFPSCQRRCYLERFVTDSDGGMQVDYENLISELFRLAGETMDVLSGLESKGI